MRNGTFHALWRRRGSGLLTREPKFRSAYGLAPQTGLEQVTGWLTEIPLRRLQRGDDHPAAISSAINNLSHSKIGGRVGAIQHHPVRSGASEASRIVGKKEKGPRLQPPYVV